MIVSKDNIFNIENPFPSWLVQYIEDQTKDVNWQFVSVPEEHEEGDKYKTPALFTDVMFCTQSNILDDHKELTKLLHTALTRDIIPNTIPDAQINTVTRTRLNGTVQNVYYVNDADGDTIFFEEDGKTELTRTKYKRGNGVLFPAHYWHTMDLTTVPFRVTIGMTYSIETKLNG